MYGSSRPKRPAVSGFASGVGKCHPGSIYMNKALAKMVDCSQALVRSRGPLSGAPQETRKYKNIIGNRTAYRLVLPGKWIIVDQIENFSNFSLIVTPPSDSSMHGVEL